VRILLQKPGELRCLLCVPRLIAESGVLVQKIPTEVLSELGVPWIHNSFRLWRARRLLLLGLFLFLRSRNRNENRRHCPGIRFLMPGHIPWHGFGIDSGFPPLICLVFLRGRKRLLLLSLLHQPRIRSPSRFGDGKLAQQKFSTLRPLLARHLCPSANLLFVVGKKPVTFGLPGDAKQKYVCANLVEVHRRNIWRTHKVSRIEPEGRRLSHVPPPACRWPLPRASLPRDACVPLCAHARP
jgi:hypothetical protein